MRPVFFSTVRFTSPYRARAAYTYFTAIYSLLQKYFFLFIFFFFTRIYYDRALHYKMCGRKNLHYYVQFVTGKYAFAARSAAAPDSRSSTKTNDGHNVAHSRNEKKKINNNIEQSGKSSELIRKFFNEFRDRAR